MVTIRFSKSDKYLSITLQQGIYMKRLFPILCLLGLISSHVFAQDENAGRDQEGTWEGKVEITLADGSVHQSTVKIKSHAKAKAFAIRTNGYDEKQGSDAYLILKVDANGTCQDRYPSSPNFGEGVCTNNSIDLQYSANFDHETRNSIKLIFHKDSLEYSSSYFTNDSNYDDEPELKSRKVVGTLKKISNTGIPK
jgi:hypothetical protein